MSTATHLLAVLGGAAAGFAGAFTLRLHGELDRQLRSYGLNPTSARLLGRAARVLRAVDAEASAPPPVSAAVAAWLADYDATVVRVRTGRPERRLP